MSLEVVSSPPPSFSCVDVCVGVGDLWMLRVWGNVWTCGFGFVRALLWSWLCVVCGFEGLRFCVMCARGECVERVECVVAVLGFQDVEVVRM